MSPASYAAKSSWTERWPQVTHALVSINNLKEYVFCASYTFLISTNGMEKTWHQCVKAQNLFTHPLLPQPLISSPSSPPPSHGLRELLAIWMLALYCEHSLIASVLPTASRASQHGAPAVCLICHCSVDIHCEKNTEEKWREWRRERTREREHL